MSEKKAKEARKITEEAANTPLFTMNITVMKNGDISIDNVPLSLLEAMDVLVGAQRAVVDHFANIKNQQTNDSRIVIPKPVFN